MATPTGTTSSFGVVSIVTRLRPGAGTRTRSPMLFEHSCFCQVGTAVVRATLTAAVLNDEAATPTTSRRGHRSD